MSFGSALTAAPRPRGLQGGVTPLRILVVEDEAVTALDLEDVLLSLGHEVVGTVDTGPAAVAAAARHRPDLVLMDIRLAGGTDGVDAAVAIRNRLGIRSIFLTAQAELETRQRGLAARPLRWLDKPFTAAKLRETLERAAAFLPCR